MFLTQVRVLAARQNNHPRPRQIVFEGNVPADIRRNEILHERLAQPALEAPPSCTAWLGEAVAIKAPTSAEFRRENGCNVLIVGQREDAAASIMAAILMSAASQRQPAESLIEGPGARFYLFEAPHGEVDPTRTLASLAAVVPHPLRIVGRREIVDVFDELANEIERRQANESGRYPDVFVMVNDLGRFRDLRRDENDLGFSFSGEAKRPTPDKQFASVLREGPSVGVYTIVWCDTLGNLNRAIDRQALREFDMRVLFQMSQNDSSYLADTPVASKLGPQLALFFNEQSGVVEKFRPYSWPAEEWLAWAARQLAPQSAGTR